MENLECEQLHPVGERQQHRDVHWVLGTQVNLFYQCHLHKSALVKNNKIQM